VSVVNGRRSLLFVNSGVNVPRMKKGSGQGKEHPHSFGEPTTRELIHVVELSVKSFVSTVEVPRS
jgi:hypothetical protein